MLSKEKFRLIFILGTFEVEQANYFVIGSIYLIFLIATLTYGWSTTMTPLEDYHILNKIGLQSYIIEYFATYKNLHIESIKLIIIIVIGGLFGLNLISSIRDNSLQTLLTMVPSKTSIILAKFLYNLLLLFVGIIIPVTIDLYLVLSSVNSIIIMYIIIFLYVFFYSTLGVLFAVLTKNEVLTILGVYLTDLGLRRLIFMINQDIYGVISNWYLLLLNSPNSIPLIDTPFVFAFWILLPTLLLIASLFYFNGMEFD